MKMKIFLRLSYAGIVLTSILPGIVGIFGSDLTKNDAADYVQFSAGVFFMVFSAILVLLYFYQDS